MGKFTAGRLLSAAIAAGALLAVSAAYADTPVPAEGTSKRIDEIKQRGALKVAVIGEFPWLVENTTGSGETFSGSSWLLAKEYARQLGVTLEAVPVSHETKIPILATGQVDITIAPLSITEERRKAVDFIEYSRSSICLFGLKSNSKLEGVKSVDDLNREDITMAYFTGLPQETWAPQRLPKMQIRGVAGSGATAPVEEIVSKRADVAPLDTFKWPELEKAVPGLVVFPDDCLRSTEMATPIGQAIDKNQPEFLAWLTAVAKEMKSAVEAEEIRTMKGE